ncbi:hypothetical protein [Agrobacterium sp.]|uniref:hypothetical protein n=1 Tax=Agrobacterium sp. TaxID=361 RepID=UPI0028ABFA38|nr:hypothetical protein [Agrobacterium sp.]
MKAIQPLCKTAADMAFPYLDTDVVEQGRHSLRRDLAIRMQHQKKPPQIGSSTTEMQTKFFLLPC